MALRVGEVTVTFEAILVCPTCDFRELPEELADRPNADVRVEFAREGELVTYCCWGCGRRRYIAEAIQIRDLRLVKPEPEGT
jgi:hypothetical protein